MKRLTDPLDYLKEDMEQGVLTWKRQLPQWETTPIERILKEAKAKTNDHSLPLVITYLRSSYITESHRFKLAIYQEEPFVDPPVYTAFLNLAFLYQDTCQQLNALIQKARTSSVRLLPDEMEEIRRCYLEQLYQQSDCFFEEVIQKINSQAPAISVYFGEEMGKLRTLGVI